MRITDASVLGSISLKIKSNIKQPPNLEKSKKLPFEVSVEDQRWHGGPKFFDVVLNQQNLKITESKMVSPVVSYYRFKAP